MRLDRKSRSVRSKPLTEDTSGIALFMVIAAVSVLSLLVTDFTYISQITQTLAFNNLDQVKAHYLAKSGFKLSLLRLKAYQQVKALAGGGGKGGGGGIPGVPKAILEEIWSFPFFYPIPTSIPGLSGVDKEMIEKFQKESGLEGHFTAIVESESGKFNINSILAPFAAPSPTPSGGAPPTPPQGQGAGAPKTFDPDLARQTLAEYLNQLIIQKSETDPDFAADYRDFKMDDFMDNLTAWMDPSYQKKNQNSRETTVYKKAPIYSMTELHMLPTMDDELYNLLAPALTASTTGGINVNTMNEATLKALVPNMTKEELPEFFKFRDNPEEDNAFKTEEDFFSYLQKNVNAFSNNKAQVDQFRTDLSKKGIRLVTDESEFKITVRAEVNHSVKVIEAWVSMTSGTTGGSQPPPPQLPPGSPPPLSGPGAAIINKPDSGFRITFMRFL